MKKGFLIFVLIVLIIANMYLIFQNSAKTAAQSTEVSMSMAETIADNLDKYSSDKQNTQNVSEDQPARQNPKINVGDINSKLRAFAHSVEFLPLGFLVCFLLVLCIRHPSKKYFSLLITVLFCIIYAVTDEFHQTFVDGRGCEFRDIVLDTLGTYLGCLIFLIIHNILPKFFSEDKK